MIIALDTSVLIFLLESDVGDRERAQRRSFVRANYAEWRDRGADFWVPAPVVAELAQALTGNTLSILNQALPSMDIRHLDALAAMRAGEVARAMPKPAPAEGARVCAKFDALIAGWADHAGVDAVATTNVRDFGSRLEAIGSKVRVLRADAPPKQLPMF